MNDFYKNLNALNDNFKNHFSDQRISLYKHTPGVTQAWQEELRVKEIRQTRLSPKDIRIYIAETIPARKESTMPVVNHFSKDLVRNKAALVAELKNYNTPDREKVLNNWIKIKETAYKSKDDLIKKNVFGQIKESTAHQAYGEKRMTAINFMTDTEDMLENVNEILPLGQKLILTDNRGKPVNATHLFHTLNSIKSGSEAMKKSGAFDMDPVKEFNPANFKFKIVDNK